MKIPSSIESRLLIVCLAVFCSPFLRAQNTTEADYIKKVGDFAGIYSGQMEAVYNSQQYANYPYYCSSDFTSGTIVYKKNNYSKQQVRLDLYKEQLIVLAPGKGYGVVVPSTEVNQVTLYDKTFKWLIPHKQSRQRTGYYMMSFEGNHLKLCNKQRFTINTKDIITTFDVSEQYFIVMNEQYYSVKNKNSFAKLFPQYKKQINSFSKEHQLNFKQDKDKSLTLLADYCEKLIAQYSKQ